MINIIRPQRVENPTVKPQKGAWRTPVQYNHIKKCPQHKQSLPVVLKILPQ